MKNRYNKVLFLAGLILLSPLLTQAASTVPAAPAVVPETSKPKEGLWLLEKLKFSGQVRVRPEFRSNLTQAIPNVPAVAEEDLSGLLRTRFGLLFAPTDHVTFFLQGQDSRDFGEEAAASPLAIGDDEGVDLHQGYIDLTQIGNKPFSIRLGRQEIKLGEERLVGSVEWSNVGRAFDGLVFGYEPEAWGLKALATIANKTAANLGDAQYFGGLYATLKKIPKSVLDFYYLILQDNDGAAGAATAGTGDVQSVHTLGSRFVTKFENGIDLGVEGAVQLGKFGSNSIFAYAAHGAFGYTFSHDLKPRLGAEYNYASGDSPTSAKVTKFNNLFPTNHDKYGLMDLTAWSNIHDASVNVSIKPGKWSAKAAYHLLAVDKNTSAADTFAGAFAGGAGLGKIAGHEMDLSGKWTMNPYFDVGAGAGYFIPGSFLKGQGFTQKSTFIYIQTSAQFN